MAMFMPIVTRPKINAMTACRRLHARRHGRRHASRATAAAAARSQATVAGSVVSNRNTPMAAPTYCEMAPTTKTIGIDHPGSGD